ncbi:hypothetical protein HWV62_18418 [Athelia sp. TMB]|nr:hypothetical protein HWV62_18418 [Athelia sp. TMB]
MLRTTLRRPKAARGRLHCPHERAYSQQPPHKSAHAQWYSDVVPAMIPVALLGSAVYLVGGSIPFHTSSDHTITQGLSLAQGGLAHEKYLEEAKAHVKELEAEVAALRAQATSNTTPGASLTAPSKRSWFGWQ